MNWGFLRRLALWAVAAVIGGVYGVAGTIGHSVSWGPVPVGLVVASVTALALLVAVRALVGQFSVTLATALGMIGAVMMISGRGPGGSVLVPNTGLSMIWLGAVALAALVVLAWPRLTPPPAPARHMPGGVDGRRLGE